MKSQKGFAVVEILLVLVLVGALATVGYYVYQTRQAQKDLHTIQFQEDEVNELADQVPPAPQIEDSSDLADAEKSLNSLDFDAAVEESNKVKTE